jgi:hypothetical protein
MNVELQLKDIEKAEKVFHGQIDYENTLEAEIQEVAKFTAKVLSTKPICQFTIQNRNFLIIPSFYKKRNIRCIQLVAREIVKVDLSTAKVLRANLEIDDRCTVEENLICGIRALLGHITGLIKPEKLD